MANGDGTASNGNGGPWWSRVTPTIAITLVALGVLGLIPGLPSPIDRLERNNAAQTDRLVSAITQHNDAINRFATRQQENSSLLKDQSDDLLDVQRELLRLRRAECLRETKGDTQKCGFPGTWVPRRANGRDPDGGPR